jgi:competence protein ComEC
MVVLKSPHHGSGTSSSEEFIRKLRPRVVLLSCGRANPYGHPVPQVMKRYEQAGSTVLRTDRDGQVEIQTNGNTLVAKTFSGRSEVIR